MSTRHQSNRDHGIRMLQAMPRDIRGPAVGPPDTHGSDCELGLRVC